MSRFYGSIEGMARTAATRRGSEKSGLVAHIRGWNVGVKITCGVNAKGEDCIRVSRTGGSNSYGEMEVLAIITEKEVFK